MTAIGVGFALLAVLAFGGTCVLLAPLFAAVFGTYDLETPPQRQALAMSTTAGLAALAVFLILVGASYYFFTHTGV